MELVGIHHYSFTVSNLDRTIDFYRNTLGLQLISVSKNENEGLAEALFGAELAAELGPARMRIAVMELNGVRIEFSEYVTPQTQSREIQPHFAGCAHIAFRVKNIETVRKRLERAGVRFQAPIQSVNLVFDRAAWQWCYFRDPDGIILEITEEASADLRLTLMADRIRELRQARGLTLKEVALRGDISVAHLSQVERGEAVPSITALLEISKALSVAADYFFRSDGTERGRSPSEENAERPHALRPFPNTDGSPVVIPASRETLTVAGGVRWQQLIHGSAPLRFVQMDYDPGASSDEFASQSNTYECCLVISGTLLLELGFEKHVLTEGCSIGFDGSVPHRVRNLEDEPATAVWATQRALAL
jgi:catechol 2,3-dioxygenase-like lactoylglutathione lyase family enzyme/transcriptional regulator with XRE-family HTH domain/mannose-6-phosphate isomerase-like protein (cupin superfamily)